jgi:hypothetical protein
MSLRRCESPGVIAQIAALSVDHAPTAIIGCPYRSRHDKAPQLHLPPVAALARISVSSSLLAATMIHKSALRENQQIVSEALRADICGSQQTGSNHLTAERLLKICVSRAHCFGTLPAQRLQL